MNIRGALILTSNSKGVNLVTGENFIFRDTSVKMCELVRTKSGRLIWEPLYNIAAGLSKKEAEEYIKEEGLVLLKRAKEPKSFLIYREADLRSKNGN